MTVTADRPRTAAATEARRRYAAQRQLIDAVLRCDLVDDETLEQVTELFMVKCIERGIPLPDVGR